MIKQINSQADINKLLLQNKEILIDFYATWCGPCKMMSLEIDKICHKYPKLLILKINIDDCQNLAKKFLIQSIPTIIYMVDAKEKSRIIGYQPMSIIEKLINQG